MWRTIFPILLILVLRSFAIAAEYYLAQNGSDSNPGTLGAPWKSLQKSIWKMQAGDSLIIRGGTYRESSYADISRPSSGRVSTIKVYPGEKVIFDGRIAGNEALIQEWSQDGQEGKWKNKLTKNWRWIDGLWVDSKYYNKVEQEDELRPFTWHHIKDTGEIRVFFEKDQNPEKKKIEFRLEAMITFDTPYWIIEGISANYYNKYGIGAWKTHHITIRNCEAYRNGGSGIETNHATNLLIEGNHTSYNGADGGPGWASGIHVFGTTSPENIIRNNISHHNRDPSDHHTDGNGFSIDKGYIDGGAEVYNNLGYSNGGRGIDIMETANVRLHHNTFINNSLDPHMANQGEVSISGKVSLTGLALSHNILLAMRRNPPLIIWDDLDPQRINSNFNFFYNLDSPNLVVGIMHHGLRSYDLLEWRKLSGQDLNSTSSNFVFE